MEDFKSYYTDRQRAVKEQFYRERGKWKWNDTWETMLMINEELLSNYSALSSVAHKKGALDIKIKTLIYVAMDAAITHLYIPGMTTHMTHGLRDLGITPEEMMEALVISASIGASVYQKAFPMLMEELERAGLCEMSVDEDLAEKENALKERYFAQFGSFSENARAVLKLDPEIFEAWINLMEGAMSKNALDEKTREILYIAVNLAPTTLDVENARRHIQKAIPLGLTKDELLEIYESVCCLGIHTIMQGIPIIDKAVAESL